MSIIHSYIEMVFGKNEKKIVRYKEYLNKHTRNCSDVTVMIIKNLNKSCANARLKYKSNIFLHTTH